MNKIGMNEGANYSQTVRPTSGGQLSSSIIATIAAALTSIFCIFGLIMGLSGGYYFGEGIGIWWGIYVYMLKPISWILFFFMFILYLFGVLKESTRTVIGWIIMAAGGLLFIINTISFNLGTLAYGDLAFGMCYLAMVEPVSWMLLGAVMIKNDKQTIVMVEAEENPHYNDMGYSS